MAVVRPGATFPLVSLRPSTRTSVHVDLPSRKATKALAAKVAAHLVPGDLIRLHGGLGAGKTFFTRALLRALGLDERVAVTSPTFVLVNEHETPKGLVLHADLYRLRESAGPVEHPDHRPALLLEVARLGLRERRGDGAIVIVEWSEGADDALGPEARLVIELARTTENSRSATLSGALAEVLA